jgi:hypothetical protein
MKFLLKWNNTIRLISTLFVLLVGYVANTLEQSAAILCVFLVLEEFAKAVVEVYTNLKAND